MSLKLGNTNIAGTQILYSTTGNNIDGAMTQAVTTSQLNLKANDADVVHKTGIEIISGDKIFNNMITNNIIPKGDITLGTSTYTWGKMIQFQDTTGKRIARIQPMAIDTINNIIGMWVNNADNTIEKGIYINSNGTTSAPASDVNNSIVTTINKSKSPNGYFQLGNGLIINWGMYGTGSGSATITYSMPYTSTPKIFAGNNYNSTGAFPGFTNVGTTSCTIHKNSGISGWWFAIGY